MLCPRPAPVNGLQGQIPRMRACITSNRGLVDSRTGGVVRHGRGANAQIFVRGAVSESGRVPLTRREREILGALAEGMSGAQIAEQLVLSPETIRTHLRNAMSKLGASTRSQAVALALQQGQIATDAAATAITSRTPAPTPPTDPTDGLATMLAGLVSLYDVDGAAVYLTDEDGLSLRRVSAPERRTTKLDLPEEVALGDGTLGRTALERRAQLIRS